MSIAITELSELGIVMITDTALTDEISDVETGNRFGYRSRVLFGAKKLFGHPASKSGLAIYGAGTLPGPISTQFVIEKFLEDHAAFTTAEQLADELAYLLTALYGTGFKPCGIQIAGMQQVNGQWHPSLYEVKNTDDHAALLQDFHVTALHPPAPVATAADRFIRIGGDVTLYSPLSRALGVVLHDLAAAGHEIPQASLQARRDYYSAQVRFVSDLYASGRMLRTIGSDVLSLSVDNNGFLYMP